MTVKLPRFMNKEVQVVFSDRAHLQCRRRWGDQCIIITWDEFKACSLGVAELVDPVEQCTRMKQALWFFAARQNIFIDD